MNVFPNEFRLNSGAVEKTDMLLVGQDMQILNPVFHQALRERNSRAVAAMAIRQAEAGAEALDLNLGPLGKNSDLLAWVMETALAAARLPLFVASHVVAQPELLRQHGEKLTINAVTADPATLTAVMVQARDCGAGLTVLLTRPGLSVCSADDRLLLAAEVVETAARVAFPVSRLYLDPLFRPGGLGMPDLESVLDLVVNLPLLSREKIQSIVAVSSASAFLPAAQRSAYHQRLLPLLAEAGVNAVILNCNDRRLMDIARRTERTARGALLTKEVGVLNLPNAKLTGINVDEV